MNCPVKLFDFIKSTSRKGDRNFHKKVALKVADISKTHANYYKSTLEKEISGYIPQSLLMNCLEDDIAASAYGLENIPFVRDHSPIIGSRLLASSNTVLAVSHDACEYVLYVTGQRMNQLRLCLVEGIVCPKFAEYSLPTEGHTIPLGIRNSIEQLVSVGQCDSLGSTLILARNESEISYLKTTTTGEKQGRSVGQFVAVFV